MNMTHRSGALARRYQRILSFTLLAEAYAADLAVNIELCMLLQLEHELLLLRLTPFLPPLLPSVAQILVQIDLRGC